MRDKKGHKLTDITHEYCHCNVPSQTKHINGMHGANCTMAIKNKTKLVIYFLNPL